MRTVLRDRDVSSERLPARNSAHDALYNELCEQIDITRVGDCSAPGIIAAAVMAGHLYARSMDAPERDVPFLRDESRIT